MKAPIVTRAKKSFWQGASQGDNLENLPVIPWHCAEALQWIWTSNFLEIVGPYGVWKVAPIGYDRGLKKWWNSRENGWTLCSWLKKSGTTSLWPLNILIQHPKVGCMQIILNVSCNMSVWCSLSCPSLSI